MIRKTLLTTALAASLALSPATVTPASADSDIPEILLGAISLGIVLNSLERRRDRHPEPSHGTVNPVDPGWGNPHGSHGRRVLPERCEFEVRTRRGWRDVFGARCLEREGVRLSRLPEECEFEINTERGPRTVFGSRCLRDYGFRVEASRH